MIILAAIKFNVLTCVGAQHETIETNMISEVSDFSIPSDGQRGFIINDGTFLLSGEALLHAIECKQIKNPKDENLYDNDIKMGEI